MSSNLREYYNIRLPSLQSNIDENGLFSLFSKEDAALILRVSLALDPLSNSTSKVATVTFGGTPSFADGKRKRISTFEWDKDFYGLTPLNHVEARAIKAE